MCKLKKTFINWWLRHHSFVSKSWHPRLPRRLRGKEPACQCKSHRRCRFDLWVGKIPWRRKWQHTEVFLPGEIHGQRCSGGLQSMGCKRVRHDLATQQQSILHLVIEVSRNPFYQLKCCLISVNFFLKMNSAFSGDSNGKESAWMQETQVQSLGQEDPLEKEMATHSSTLAWRIPWTEEPGGLLSMGLQRVRHD